MNLAAPTAAAASVRVLAVTAGYPPDQCVGSWLMMHSLLRALVDRGHRADVLTAGSRNPYWLDGVEVRPSRGGDDLLKSLEQADVLVTQADAADRAIGAAKTRGVPVVRLVHNTSALTESVLRRRRVALTVFNSQHMKTALSGLADRSIVVRPSVRPEDYKTTPGSNITLINLSRDKGAEIFYSLAERFTRQRFLGVEGGYGAQVVDDLANVELLPHLPTHRMREEVYARTRILVMPSLYESWGCTGVEAMCSGIPVIAHPTPGLRESLGDAGIFVDRGDIDAWEAALRRLLDVRTWTAASRRAEARIADLDPAADLFRWCNEIERLGTHSASVLAQQ